MGTKSEVIFDYQMVLDAIDALRARKARPDKARICSHVLRKYGFERDETLLVLDHAVLDGIVLKVRYKDGYSYRNPGRSVKAKVRPGVIGSSTCTIPLTRHRVLLAVRRLALTATEEDGVPLDKVLVDLHSGGQATVQEENATIKVLKREIERGTLKLLENGNYLPNSDFSENAQDDDELQDSDNADANQDNSSSPEPPLPEPTKKRPLNDLVADRDNLLANCDKKLDDEPQLRGRPASQRKKFKKSLGPDFLDPSDLRYGSFGGKAAFDPKCVHCGNGFVAKEDTLSCNRCPLKAHIMCLKEKGELEDGSEEWLCGTCESRGSQEDEKPSVAKDAKMMQICASCDKEFPQAMEKLETAEDSLNCSECEKSMIVDKIAKENGQKANETNTNVAKGTSGNKTSNPLPKIENSVPKHINGNALVNNYAVVYDDGTKTLKKPVAWSVDDVEQFVNAAGFPKEAVIFKHQEIDGKSLMLLRREDVLSGLQLKLGPAVKIFAHINQLQVEHR